MRICVRPWVCVSVRDCVCAINLISLNVERKLCVGARISPAFRRLFPRFFPSPPPPLSAHSHTHAHTCQCQQCVGENPLPAKENLSQRASFSWVADWQRSIGNKLKYATIKSLNCEFVFRHPFSSPSTHLSFTNGKRPIHVPHIQGATDAL